MFFRHFLNQIQHEVDKNLRRYISELTGKIFRLHRCHSQTGSAVLQFINNELNTVEYLRQKNIGNHEELKKYRERLKEIKLMISLNDKF